ncbi:unnamed protein product, partial [Chrysoparadoxa australica]
GGAPTTASVSGSEAEVSGSTEGGKAEGEIDAAGAEDSAQWEQQQQRRQQQRLNDSHVGCFTLVLPSPARPLIDRSCPQFYLNNLKSLQPDAQPEVAIMIKANITRAIEALRVDREGPRREMLGALEESLQLFPSAEVLAQRTKESKNVDVSACHAAALAALSKCEVSDWQQSRAGAEDGATTQAIDHATPSLEDRMTGPPLEQVRREQQRCKL